MSQKDKKGTGKKLPKDFSEEQPPVIRKGIRSKPVPKRSEDK